jgi:ribosomal protein L12E/L44/L45/RPP1/RPP2
MNQEKYMGMDVHDATISAAVKNAEGKLLMECALETKARIASAANGNSGPIVGWALRPATARNTALCADNCNV